MSRQTETKQQHGLQKSHDNAQIADITAYAYMAARAKHIGTKATLNHSTAWQKSHREAHIVEITGHVYMVVGTNKQQHNIENFPWRSTCS
jgi:hypothetical protein